MLPSNPTGLFGNYQGLRGHTAVCHSPGKEESGGVWAWKAYLVAGFWVFGIEDDLPGPETLPPARSMSEVLKMYNLNQSRLCKVSFSVFCKLALGVPTVYGTGIAFSWATT